MKNRLKQAMNLVLVWMLLFALPQYSHAQYSTAISGPISPTAAAMSFGKYADMPIDPRQGTTAIGLPIYTVSEGTLNHSVSLSYHTGGLRVSEIASEVGLGWNLNAGGVIGRTVRGLPDDHENGYYHKGNTLNGGSNEVEDAANGDIDTEPDLFYYNFNGMAGKFVIDKNKNVVMIPKADIKIVPFLSGDTFAGFRVYTPDGTIYYMGYRPATSGFIPYNQQTIVGTQDAHIDVWYLGRTESFDRKHQIDFNYTSNNYKYVNLNDCYVTKHIKSNGNIKTCNKCNNAGGAFIYVHGRILSSITTSTATINFTTASRQDLPAYLGTPKRISKIAINNGDKCYEYELTHTYFDGGAPLVNGLDLITKRLKLDKIQKKACGGGEQEEPYLLTYNGTFFPTGFSRSLDHWGFYNGISGNNNADNMIPQNTQVTILGNTLTYGSAIRTPVEAHMIKGTLKRITYPTKGYTEYDYEANEYKDFTVTGNWITEFTVESCDKVGSNYTCCDGLAPSGLFNNSSDPHYEVITQEMINTGKLTLTCQNNSSVNCPPHPYADHNASVIIRDQTNGGSYVASYSINMPTTQSVKNLYVDLDEIPNLVPGHNYKFTVYSANALGKLNLRYKPNSAVVKVAGGLRIERIKTHDGISSANDIIRTFDYVESDGTTSSGVLTNRPTYGFAIASNIALFSSSSVLALTTSEGAHITYSRVKESYNGNGYVEYLLDTESYSSSDIPSYPVKPSMYLVKNGVAKEQNTYNQSNTLIAKQETIRKSNDNYANIPGIVYAAKDISWKSGVSCSNNKRLKSSYKVRTNIYRPSKVINMLDGVTTETNYEYHPQNSVLTPVKTYFTNSDGKVNETRTKYLVDYAHSSTLKTNMLNRHMIGIPYETTLYVDGAQLDGTRTHYSNFQSNGVRTNGTSTSYYPRPYTMHRYERTWVNEVLQAGEWVMKGYNHRYNSYGLLYRSQEVNWNSVYYTYNSDKLLISKRFNGHSTTYTFYPNSSLLNTIRAVDGTTTTYTYDDLMRMKTQTDDCNNITTSLNYFYTTNLGNTKNYIETTKTYPVADHSSINTIKNRAYKDGLGRNIQTVGIKQAPNNKDILNSTVYDNRGRIKYSYQQRQSSYGNGKYVAPTSTWHKTEYQYNASPLGRIYRSKPQDWHWTYYAYGNNSGTDNVKKNGTTTAYPNATLAKRTVFDEDFRATIQFTDRKGRTILSRQTNNLDNVHKRLDTYSLYDDKDRVRTVLPPGALSSSIDYRNLWYKYEYDQEDHLIKKKVPGMLEVKYKYNDRDLLGGYQDGNLLVAGKWYTYEYDALGRETKQGFFNGTPTTNFTPTDPQIETIYGSNAYDKDKVVSLKTKKLGTSTWLTSNNTYNSCGVLTDQSGNSHVNTQANSVTSNIQYDGAFNVTRTLSSVNAHNTTKTIQDVQTYDHVGRARLNYFKVDNGADVIVGNNVYNAEEELTRKYQGKAGDYYLQQINYAYKNHGSLYQINSSNLQGSEQAWDDCSEPVLANPGNNYHRKDLFYLQLYYDSSMPGISTTHQKNGNIAGVRWQVKGRSQGAYSYKYDDYNRLIKADYYDIDDGVVSNSDRYDGTYYYDKRGNITTIARNGMYDAGGCAYYGLIDNIVYTYHANTNQIKSIRDWAFPTIKHEGFSEGDGGIYLYDLNGNMTFHPDKKVTITYNHLNLPTQVSFVGTTNRITMSYDATGTLLNRTTFAGNIPLESRDYIGGIQYVNGKVNQIEHSEGYVQYDVNGARPTYHYLITDHLGNTRLIYTDKNNNGRIESANEIVQENHYYPFGMKMKGAWMGDENANKYKYNGIEEVDDFGLDLSFATFRMLDPTIGRWLQVDPVAEALHNLSPYQSMNNNPISFADPDGDLPFLAVVGIGAAAGVFGNGLSNVSNGQSFFNGAGKAALWGGIGSAAAFGIGSAAGGIFGQSASFGKAAFQVGAHGLSNGLQSHLQGGNFGQGFLSGAISSGISSGMGENAGLQILGGGIGGGIGSVISGGNFFEGMTQGLLVGGFNHALHSSLGGGPGDPPTKEELRVHLAGEFLDGNITRQEYLNALALVDEGPWGLFKQVVSNNKGEIAATVLPVGRLGMLNRYFASLEQLSQSGKVIAQVVRDAPRLVAKYGGKASDWKKMSSTTYAGKDGFKFSIHWYKNAKTGLSVEHKTVLGR